MPQTEPTTEASPAPPLPEHANYAEQLVFEHSPLNLWLTGALIYAALIITYALAAALDRTSWITDAPTGPMLDYRVRLAAVLPLIICASLCLQRFSRLGEVADSAAFARALRPGARWQPEFPMRRLRLVTALGLGVGVGAVVIASLQGGRALSSSPATFAWFSVTAAILGALFFRGLVLTRAAANHTRRIIEDGLEIDLLKIEMLYPWGRAAGRTSLVWFTVCASTLLLFVSSGFTLFTVGMVAGCGLIGLWVFIGAMSQMHHRIRQVKGAELDTLRNEIAALRPRLKTEPAAAGRLQSLLAYEARIAEAPEWPVDQTILVRVCISSLILTVPWFGQAFAGAVVGHLGR